MGPYWEDATPITFAGLLAEELGGFNFESVADSTLLNCLDLPLCSTPSLPALSE